ncbi:MAG: rRNA small subunit methyltransferase, glucose inhibited division protein GidB [Oscillospiraceae bacterium]|nr:rRNA small subunit methyltransferase, glucose inhibited division protein GidB [Oscillospiraceae bacterium]
MRELIQSGLDALGLAPPPRAVEQLEQYSLLLQEKNQVMNLTAITDPTEIVQLHFLDCAAILGCCNLEGRTLIDVGTGAGFPGLVLKILVPSLKLTLLDGLQKRLTWLEEVCKVLSLSDVTYCHARAEDRGHDAQYRQQFDYATARAVADLKILAELCLPFVKTGGNFLAMKTADCQQEVDASIPSIIGLGGMLMSPHQYTIPGTAIARTIIRIEKQSETPSKYPRRWTKMQNESL